MPARAAKITRDVLQCASGATRILTLNQGTTITEKCGLGQGIVTHKLAVNPSFTSYQVNLVRVLEHAGCFAMLSLTA